jgi:hypothetical protein
VKVSVKRRPATFVILFSVLFAFGLVTTSGQKQVKYEQVVNRAPTSVYLSCSNVNIEAGQQVQFTAKVSPVQPTVPKGSVVFTATGVKPGNTVTSQPIALDGTGAATWVSHFSSADAYIVLAIYSGEVNYLASKSTAVGLTVTGSPDFQIVVPGPVTIHRGNTWSATIPIESLNGFTGSIFLQCERLSDMLCRLSPSVVRLAQASSSTGSSPGIASAITTITIQTFPKMIATAGLLGLLFGLSPVVLKRKPRVGRCGVSLVILFFFLTGCGAYVHFTYPNKTALGVYRISISGTSGKITHTTFIKVTVVK